MLASYRDCGKTIGHRTSALAPVCATRHQCRSRRSVPVVVAMQQGPVLQAPAQPLQQDIKVVGMGSCGVDYLASVAAYPRPDEKLRTETLEVQGGGNAANALTASARLGLKPLLVTKIGGDGLGDGILTELKGDGISTAHVLRAPGHPSPFTYIIVDRSGGTRTCIHTPGAALAPEEMSGELISSALQGAALVYFDGRLTEAALLLAKAARSAGIPVLVEAERLRPGLDDLLALADYVVTSAHFPQDWTGEAQLSDAVLATLTRLPSAKFIITTLGTSGSILVERAPSSSSALSPKQQSLQEVMNTMQQQLAAQQQQQQAAGEGPDCLSKTGVAIKRPSVATLQGPLALTFSDGRDTSAAARQAEAAASRAAALNADSGNASGYAMKGNNSSSSTATLTVEAPAVAPVVAAHVVMAGIAALLKEAVVDTTGAGDAFIGSVLYSLALGLSRPQMLQLASVVAACKCTELGARPGLPTRSHLAADLMSPA